jgi:hypothetical protein
MDRPWRKYAVPALAVALITLFVAVGFVDERRGGSPAAGSAEGQQAGDTVVHKSQRDPAGTDGVYGAPVPEPAEAGQAGIDDQGGAAVSADIGALDPQSLAGRQLRRTGDLAIEVGRDKLAPSVRRIAAITQGLGGYVLSSSLGTGGDGPVALAEDAALPKDGDLGVAASGDGYAFVTVRVPERLFDEALRRFSALGVVTSVTTSAEDVTGQYVDLQARLRHFRAVEARLLRFLAETDTVSQMLAVQDRLDKVQLTIEELSAQLKSLRAQTDYGTLSVSLYEKGREVQAGAGGGFSDTFLHSLQLLGRGARLTALALTAALPFLVVIGGLGAAVWYVVRRLRRSRTQPAPPGIAA